MYIYCIYIVYILYIYCIYIVYIYIVYILYIYCIYIVNIYIKCNYMYIVYIQTDGRTEIYFVIKNVAHLVILLTSSSVAFSDTLKIRASSLNRRLRGNEPIQKYVDPHPHGEWHGHDARKIPHVPVLDLEVQHLATSSFWSTYCGLITALRSSSRILVQ